MKKSAQSGFALVELVLVVVIVAAIIVGGYFVWREHNPGTPATTATTTSSPSTYQSPPVTTPTAPQVDKASDLNSAMQTLNQTNVGSSNTDSSQLSTESNGF